jgi:O-succinylbenzoic acid--CoA ligase
VTRPLAVVDAADVERVTAALRSALTGDGPAVMPHAYPASVGAPATVEQRIALVVETSGSTGTPKRVALSAHAVLAGAAASDAALGGPGQWLLALPLTYIAGINVVVRSIASGTEPVAMNPDGFSAERFADAAGRRCGSPPSCPHS